MKTVWVKWYTTWHTTAPNANTASEYVRESWERGRSGTVQVQQQLWLVWKEAVIGRGTGRSPEELKVCACVMRVCVLTLIFIFLFSFVGEVVSMEGRKTKSGIGVYDMTYPKDQ